jgi:asparagine synthase (glutamine-hydrolysing)
MCGIAGLLDLTRGQPAGALKRTAQVMAGAVAHRGPDGDGVWADELGGLALGHQRLAVIDPSAAGDQPMTSADGRFVISYNGEIYNAAELRDQLDAAGARHLRGRCDTEVLLEACARWGVEDAVRRTVGMFAFALWDKRERILALARDRVGIKPLYWGRVGQLIVFASELKSLTRAPGFTRDLDPVALAAYFRLAYVPAPSTVYRGIFKVRPGHILTVGSSGAVSERCYWDLATIAAAGSHLADPLDAAQATEGLEALLDEAVRARLVSDVPLGAFLSGGIDSTAVVASMQALSAKPVKTFTVGFEDAGCNEAPRASAVAAHLGTDHTELTVSASDALEVLPGLAGIYDEPFADASAIPMVLVSRLARSAVTVALSGDGGDELFAGYDRYRLSQTIRMPGVPGALRRAAGGAMGAVHADLWQTALGILPKQFNRPGQGDRIAKLGRVLKAGDDNALYRAVLSIWETPGDILRIPGCEAESDAAPPPIATQDFLSLMQYLDTASYLPDDILVKLDRASMAVGLEARVPILDHRVVEFAWRLPVKYKRRRGQSKWLLRQVVERHVPRNLIDRPKMGFNVPVGDWIRGPLRDWAEALLDPARIKDEGLLAPDVVARTWAQHQDGRHDWTNRLWTILMFRAWCEKWR